MSRRPIALQPTRPRRGSYGSTSRCHSGPTHPAVQRTAGATREKVQCLPMGLKRALPMSSSHGTHGGLTGVSGPKQFRVVTINLLSMDLLNFCRDMVRHHMTSCSAIAIRSSTGFIQLFLTLHVLLTVSYEHRRKIELSQGKFKWGEG